MSVTQHATANYRRRMVNEVYCTRKVQTTQVIGFLVTGNRSFLQNWNIFLETTFLFTSLHFADVIKKIQVTKFFLKLSKHSFRKSTTFVN